METTNNIQRPNKRERELAQESYSSLISSIKQLKLDQVEIEIEEIRERIILPLKALNLLSEILKAMSQGKPISIVPLATEVTTQSAAEILRCSRPYLVKLLEEGGIEYTQVGKHRRIKYEDVMDYKQKMKKEQKQRLVDMMQADEDLGFYNS
jgi:excisionase family DNA binding protein